VFAQLDERVTYDDADRLTLSVKPPGRAAANVELAVLDATQPSLAAGALSFGAGVAVTRDDATSAWELSVSGFPAVLSVVGAGGEVRLDPEKLEDVAVLCQLTF
jgi:hypothetical protein